MVKYILVSSEDIDISISSPYKCSSWGFWYSTLYRVLWETLVLLEIGVAPHSIA